MLRLVFHFLYQVLKNADVHRILPVLDQIHVLETDQFFLEHLYTVLFDNDLGLDVAHFVLKGAGFGHGFPSDLDLLFELRR